MPELVVAYSNGQVEKFPLGDQEIFIGRDTQVAVSIPDSKISRRHARLFLRRGAWWIEDLQSVNGVVVDGVRISGPVVCPVGIPIHIGDAELHIAVDAAPKPVAKAQTSLPQESAAQWALVVTSGALAGQKVVLAHAAAWVVGRDSTADVVLADASVSRRHARLVPTADGLMVSDLQSSNGTFVADRAIEQALVREGDSLRLGNIGATLQRLENKHPAQIAQGRNQAKSEAKIRAKKAPSGPLQKRQRLMLLLAVGMVMAFGGLFVARSWLKPTKIAKQKGVHAKATPSAKKGDNDGMQDTVAPSVAEEAPDSEPVTSGAEVDGRTGPLSAAETPAQKPKAKTSPHGADPAPKPASSIAPNPHSVGARCSRAMARLFGHGPSAEEQARTRHLATLFAQAEAQVKQADRDGARTTLKELLKADALHGPGRALLRQLERKVRETEALRRAQTLLQAGQTLEALGTVSEALDQPYPGEPLASGQHSATPEALELRDLAEQAKLQLGQACGERAQVACTAQAWQTCVAQLACFLGYSPENIQGLALLTLAQDALGVRPNGQQATPLLTQAQTALDTLTNLYPQAALRQAVLLYNTGDVGAAAVRLHALNSAPCRAVLTDVRQIALNLPRAKQLRESGQTSTACDVYDEILAVDARLSPPPVPSVLRELAKEGKQSALLSQGEAAFVRGAYPDAYSAWSTGLLINTHHTGLTQAMVRLHHRAEELMGPWLKNGANKKEHRPLTHEACSHLRDVVAMTPEEDPLHTQAVALTADCKGSQTRLTGQ